MWHSLHDDEFSCFDRTHACERQTNRQTHRHSIYLASIAYSIKQRRFILKLNLVTTVLGELLILMHYVSSV